MEKLHTGIFHIFGVPINEWSVRMASSIFEEEHQQLVAILKAARKRSGLRQIDVGEKVGRSQSFISIIEKGQRRVDVIEFIALSRAMGQDPRVLLKKVLGARK